VSLNNLQKIGNAPHSKHHRIFYVVLKGNEMILLHAYLKKTPKAPVKEIQIAKQRMKQLPEGKR
jgi:phage-related protein